MSEKQKLDPELVRQIGFLARLNLSDEEVTMFSEQLSTIIGYFDMLAEVDIEGVPPARLPAMTRDMLRKDEVKPSMPREDLLVNAPAHQDGCVRVPVVIDTEG